MMAQSGFIVFASYIVEEGLAYVELFGRLKSGESFRTLSRFEPYFYIKEKDFQDARRHVDATFSKTGMRDFSDSVLMRVAMTLPAEVKKARDALEEKGIECFEADIPFETRFLIDNKIRGYVEIDGIYTPGRRVDRTYINPRLAPAQGPVDLAMLSIDIETSERALEDSSQPIYSVALYAKRSEEVLIVGDDCANATCFKTEKELLKALKKRIVKIDPDVIIGWNIVDFDLVYLDARYRACGLVFDAGRDDSPLRLLKEHSFIRASRAQVRGRMVLDGMHILRDFFYKFEDYRLDTAGKALLREGKRELAMSISELYEKDRETLADYNLQDARLVYRIMESERLVEIAMELSSITGMMLDRVKASIATLDSLYIRKARKMGIACPSVARAKKSAVVGGHVEEPKSGLYEYVLLFDFRSLYPSIIATFNIGPLTYGKGNIRAPNGAMFGTGKSILPEIILELLQKRKQAKSEGGYTKQFAIKIIMNSIFGVLGNPHCRFHNADMANAVTSFGRHILTETRSHVESMGNEVIYGDTDSIFVVSNAKTRKDALERGKEIVDGINDFYSSFVHNTYGRESHLLLEFEKVFDTFFLARQRHEDKGAKKRYAGMVEGKLKIVGLEYVRRDWTLLAKNFQYTLLTMVFEEKDYVSFIRDYVKRLKSGELDGMLVYKKRLRKPIEGYTKTTPPHVKAAKLLTRTEKDTGALIEYIMTKRGPQPVGMGGTPDYDHYLAKQIRPIAESVLAFLPETFDGILAHATQKKITDYYK